MPVLQVDYICCGPRRSVPKRRLHIELPGILPGGLDIVDVVAVPEPELTDFDTDVLVVGVGRQQIEFLSHVAAVATGRAKLLPRDRVERIVFIGELNEVLRGLKLQLLGRLH